MLSAKQTIELLPDDVISYREFYGRFPEAWLEYRLCFVDEQGKPRKDSIAYRDAVHAFWSAFFPGIQARYSRFQNFRFSEELGRYAPTWEQSLLLRPRKVDGKGIPALPTSRRDFLSHLWKAEIQHVGGWQGLGAAMFGARYIPEEYPEILPLLLGGGRDSFQKSLAWKLRVPPRERWVRLSPSTDRLAYFVVDLDCKRDADRSRLQDWLRLFLLSPSFPRPALITTSNSGIGRHVYYLSWLIGPSKEQREKEHRPVTITSTMFRERLLELLHVQDLPANGVEIFPKSDSLMDAMPYLPFGAGLRLCNASGEPLGASLRPLDALVQWSREVADNSPTRIDRRALKRMSLEGVSEALLKRIRESCTQQAVPQSLLVSDEHGEEGSAGQSQELAGRLPWTLEAAEWLIQHGPREGMTQYDLPIVVSYWKFHSAGNCLDDVMEMAIKWLGVEDASKSTRSHYMSRVRGAYKRIEYPLSVSQAPEIFMLCASDVDAVAELLKTWDVGAKARRKVLLLLMLYFVGVARASGKDSESGRVVLAIPARVIQGWRSLDYRKQVGFLKRRGWLLEVQRGRRRTEAAAGIVTTYSIPISVGMEPEEIPNKTDVFEFLKLHLSDELGRELFDPGWKRWKKSVGRA